MKTAEPRSPSTPASPREREVGFYVATTGCDEWSGQLDVPNADGSDGPFATLRRARNEIRELKAGSGTT